MRRKYIIVQHKGKMNATFKVTNPKKIAFWKAMVQGGGGISTTTKIIEEGYDKIKEKEDD